MTAKISKILYATDLSKNSAYALSYAWDLAKIHKAQIIVLHVMEGITGYSSTMIESYFDVAQYLNNIQERKIIAKEKVEKRLNIFCEKVLKIKKDQLFKSCSIEICEGYPAEEIIQKSKLLNCDIIIMGTHSKGIISQTFLGSVAKRVLRRVRKPIFIIPLPEEEIDLTLSD